MIDFQQIADCLDTIQTTSGKLAKESLLRKYGETYEGFKDIMKFIYDPYFTTGLKQAKLDNTLDILQGCEKVEDIMVYLRENNTGTSEAAAVANGFIYASEDPNWQWAATGLVTKDLQLGVSVTTLNNVYGKGFIPKIGIMRGMLCPDDAYGWFLVTEKIDGNRRLIMNKETGVEIYTRSGKRDSGLVDIEKEVAEHLPKGFVFDCECVAEGAFADSIELRQASASILNRRNQKRTGVHALCFDMIKQSDYDAGISKMNALGRKTMAAATFGDYESIKTLTHIAELIQDDYHVNTGKTINLSNSVNALWGAYRRPKVCKHISVLPILGYARDKKDGIELAKPIWDVNGEGVMMVAYQSPYEVNPNPRKTLLKIKMLKEFECQCTGVFEGDNKYAGSLGGIFIDYADADGKHWKVGVGTGFTDVDRQYYWEHPEDIVGQIVEIDSFGESTNGQGGKSLNCPVFKRIKGQEE